MTFMNPDQTPATGRQPGRRTLVLGLSLVQLIAWGSLLYSFAVFLDPVEVALEMSRAQTSLGFSLALLVEGLLAFRVGRWIDAGHERVLMTGGSVLAGVALIGHGLVHSAAGFTWPGPRSEWPWPPPCTRRHSRS